ncbi:FecR family protein [Achromobacter xylosoxidans]
MTPDIDRQAVQWMVRLCSGSATADDQSRFRQWCEAAPAHARAWQALQTSVGAPLQALRAAGMPCADGSPLRDLLARGPSRRQFLGKTLALVGVGVGSAWLGRHLWLARADVSTGTAQRLSIALEDGSRLDLDAHTAVRLEFTDAVRRVRLLHGALVAAVTRDTRRPFGVTTEDGTAWTHGAEYMVRKGTGHSLAAVLLREARIDSRSGQQMDLGQGRAACYGADGIQALEAESATALAAWRQGRLDVLDAPLAVVADALRPYMPGALHLSERAAALRVQGVFPLDHPDQAWAALAATLPLTVTRYGGWLTWVDAA